MRALLLLSAALLLCGCARAYDNGVARLPPMGWNTWCTDDLCGLHDVCTEKEIKSVVDSMVEQGLDKLGYQYINMDDCWSAKTRNATGHLQADPTNFPSGLAALADYIHARGLKFGLYTCVGTKTCRGDRPASYGHWDIDAQTFASWGMDFIKADNCNKPSNITEREAYGNLSRALNATGRPILFSLCEWGNDNVQTWGGTVGQMYRIQMDHLPFWHFPPKGAGSGLGQGTGDIIEYIGTLKPSTFVAPYAWMDPDFLETLLQPTMTFIDSRTEYTFWALWSAPLLVATDVRKMTDEKRQILMNPEVIAIDQDPLGRAGDRLFNASSGAQAWAKQLQNGDQAVVLYNANNLKSAAVAVTWDMIGWQSTDQVRVRNLWNRTDEGVLAGGYSVASLQPHDVVFLRLTRVA